MASNGRNQSQAHNDQRDQAILKVRPTKQLWTDQDTGKSFIIQNRGQQAISVDFNGTIPSRFDKNCSGRRNFQERQEYKRRTQPSSELEMIY